jgi:hypothetical protein
VEIWQALMAAIFVEKKTIFFFFQFVHVIMLEIVKENGHEMSV